MNNKFSFRFFSFLAATALAITSTLVVHASTKQAPVQAAAVNPVNLAWFYKPPADGNVSLIAQNFSTYIMTKGNEATRNQLISAGASAPMLEYLRFEAIMDPGSCTATPWQNNVAYKVGDFCDISTNHPDWFLLNTSGQRISSLTGAYSFYLMDPGNAGWRAFFVDRVSQVMAADPVWAGVFLDNVEVTNQFHIDDNNPMQKYPDNASFQAAVQGFLQYMHDSYFQPNGKLLYANIVARTDDTLFTSYMTYLDGGMHEGWAIDDPDRWRPVSTWETHLNLVEQAQALGKKLILVSHGTQADIELQNFAFASYLLVSDGNTAFRYGSGAAYNQAWLYDNYKLQIGSPLGARYKVGSAWKRDFSNGSVSVDPGTHAVSISINSLPTATLPAAQPTATFTAVPPTATAIQPTATAIRPTATAVQPTATAIRPTATVVPPTATAIAPVPTQSTTYENDNAAFVYSSGWSVVKDGKASGGNYRKSTVLKSSIKLSFTGSTFKVAYLTQPKGGSMQVLVDGVLMTTLNQKTTSIMYIQTWRLMPENALPYGKHLLTLIFTAPSSSTVTMDRVTIY